MTQSMLGRGTGVSAGALALAAVCAATPTSAGKDILLAPHRAVYEMTLVTTRGGTGVTAVSGRMVYELTGSYGPAFISAALMAFLATGMSLMIREEPISARPLQPAAATS